jgi:hypothetical protein
VIERGALSVKIDQLHGWSGAERQWQSSYATKKGPERAGIDLRAAWIAVAA